MRTIVVGARGQFEMIVDDVDYDFLIGFRWTFARSHPGAVRELIYARRCVTVTDFALTDRWGDTVKVTKKFDLFVHHVVLARMGYPAPPQPRWTADHRNKRTLDNRRENLRWASPEFQVLNRAGSHKRGAEHARMVAEALERMAPEHTFPVVPVAASPLLASCPGAPDPAPAPGGTVDAARLTAPAMA